MLLFLAGCASASPSIGPKTVKEPTPVACAPKLGPEPIYPDTDAALRAAPDLFTQVQLLVGGRLMRIERDIEKSAALAACEAGQ